MDIQISIQTVSIVITMLSIVSGIGLGIIQFRNLVKTRRIQLYMELFNKLTEKEIQRNFTEVLMIWKRKERKVPYCKQQDSMYVLNRVYSQRK